MAANRILSKEKRTKKYNSPNRLNLNSILNARAWTVTWAMNFYDGGNGFQVSTRIKMLINLVKGATPFSLRN